MSYMSIFQAIAEYVRTCTILCFICKLIPLIELEFRQEKGYISKSTLLLCVEDPHCKVGSGGATLNALLIVAEHLSALSGHTVKGSFY